MSIQEVSHDFSAINDPVTAAHLQFLAEHVEKPIAEARIEKEAAFVFRTRAGTIENLRITLPTITHKDASDEKLGPKVTKVYQRKYGRAGVKQYEDLKERVGGRSIKFARIGIGKGCVYQTSDPVVAEFLRGEVKSGRHNGLYEDYATSAPLRSRFTNQTFPNTEQGRHDLALHDIAFEKSVQTEIAKRRAAAPVVSPDGPVGSDVAAPGSADGSGSGESGGPSE